MISDLVPVLVPYTSWHCCLQCMLVFLKHQGHFQQTYKALAPGGLICQAAVQHWIQVRALLSWLLREGTMLRLPWQPGSAEALLFHFVSPIQKSKGLSRQQSSNCTLPVHTWCPGDDWGKTLRTASMSMALETRNNKAVKVLRKLHDF